MIKNFLNLSYEEREKFLFDRPQTISVYEKLDMIYFKVMVRQHHIFAVWPKTGEAISEIDCITNSDYMNICKWAEHDLKEYHKEILNICGECILGFFYLPRQNVKQTVYNQNYELIGKMIYSDCYTFDPEYKNTNIWQAILYKVSMPEPKICNLSSDLFLNKNIIEIDNPKEAISELIGDRTSITNLKCDEIYGIILRKGNTQYKIMNPISEIHIDKDSKMLCRNIVLKDFCDVIGNDKIGLMSIENDKTGLSYIGKICILFKAYINSTDLFNKCEIEEEDLIPPYNGIPGDLVWDNIEDETVKTIIRINRLYKRIFMLILYTFSKKRYDIDSIYANKIYDALNYRNYKNMILMQY